MKKQIVRESSPPTSRTDPEAKATAVLEAPEIQAAQKQDSTLDLPPTRRKARAPVPTHTATRFQAMPVEDASRNHQAELFYLQKQIQLQTRMVFVMEDGSSIQGIVEWYDRHSIKVRGRSRVLIFKSAIKYLHKAGDSGTGTDE